MISEPTTLITDYLLALLTLWLAWRLRSRHESQRSRKSWALAFLALGFAAAVGGTYHGFATVLDETTRFLLWKTTVLAIGLAAAAMIVGAAVAMARPVPRLWLTRFAFLAFALYAAWMLSHNAYVFVVIDTAVAMLVVAVLHGGTARARRVPGSRWMLGAVAMSAIAAGVQAGHVALHEHFNHNDLYHVLQMGAMAMFYAGARELRDLS